MPVTWFIEFYLAFDCIFVAFPLQDKLPQAEEPGYEASCIYKCMTVCINCGQIPTYCTRPHAFALYGVLKAETNTTCCYGNPMGQGLLTVRGGMTES